MRYVSSVILVLLVLSTIGCGQVFTDGRKIDAAKTNALAPGQANAEVVRANFGTPDKVEPAPMGGEKYIYNYYKEIPHWWTITEMERQRLEIVLQNGVVQNYRFATEEKGPITKE